MLRLAALVVVLGGLAAAFCLVPLRGRTALARFQAAPDAGTFLSSAWQEWRTPPRAAPPRRAKPVQKPHARHEPLARAEQPVAERAPARRAEPAAPPAPPAPPPPPAARRGTPAEEHSESDRAALDRLLSDRSR